MAPVITSIFSLYLYSQNIKPKKNMKRIQKKSVTLLLASGIITLAISPLRASETDDRIESAAKNSYVFRTYLKDDSIKTSSKDGVVTLTGSVSEKSHKALASDTVAELPGVTKVDDQIEVKPDSSGEMSDAWLETKIKSTLLFHKNVRGSHTHVSVKDGVVTLKGDAVSTAQKELTADYTTDIEGVKDVKNEMTVVEPNNTAQEVVDKIDDASVSAQVKWSLLAHRSTSALKTHVKTKNGVVTVRGNADSTEQKELVTTLVDGIKGVSETVNEMKVK